MRVRLLVFDLDDTLYPERAFVLGGLRAAGLWAAEQGIVQGLGETATQLFEQGSRGRIFDEALTALGARPDPERVAALIRVYREHAPQLPLFEDAAWALATFRPLAALAILTDGPQDVQRSKVAALGLDARVDRVLYTDALGREHWKPSPRGFRLLMEQFGVAGSEAAYVGDNASKDFVAPNALGWVTVRVDRGFGEYRNRVAPAGGEASVCCSDLRELAGILGATHSGTGQ